MSRKRYKGRGREGKPSENKEKYSEVYQYNRQIYDDYLFHFIIYE